MGDTLIFITIAAFILVLGGSVFLIKKMHSPEKVEEKYASSDHSKNIFIKKYKEADIEYYRGSFMRLGLISVLLLLILAFKDVKRDLSNNTNIVELL